MTDEHELGEPDFRQIAVKDPEKHGDGSKEFEEAVEDLKGSRGFVAVAYHEDARSFHVGGQLSIEELRESIRFYIKNVKRLIDDVMRSKFDERF